MGSGSGDGSGPGIGPGASGSSGGAVSGGAPGGVPGPAPSIPNGGLTLAESLGLASRADEVSPEKQRRRRQLSTKMNPSIVAVIERLKNKNAQASADEARFVRNGKAEIQVWLMDKSPETIAQLKQLGFEVVLDPKAAKLIIGRLPIEKLAALAELKSVRYVATTTSN